MLFSIKYAVKCFNQESGLFRTRQRRDDDANCHLQYLVKQTLSSQTIFGEVLSLFWLLLASNKPHVESSLLKNMAPQLSFSRQLALQAASVNVTGLPPRYPEVRIYAPISCISQVSSVSKPHNTTYLPTYFFMVKEKNHAFSKHMRINDQEWVFSS